MKIACQCKYFIYKNIRNWIGFKKYTKNLCKYNSKFSTHIDPITGEIRINSKLVECNNDGHCPFHRQASDKELFKIKLSRIF